MNHTSCAKGCHLPAGFPSALQRWEAPRSAESPLQCIISLANYGAAHKMRLPSLSWPNLGLLAPLSKPRLRICGPVPSSRKLQLAESGPQRCLNEQYCRAVDPPGGVHFAGPPPRRLAVALTIISGSSGQAPSHKTGKWFQ